jgi:hypothetical protein
MNQLAQTSLMKLLPALAVVGTLFVYATKAAHAGAPGMFGLAHGQVARINAVHIGDPSFSAIQFEAAFLDASGKIVARSNIQTIKPGQATFFDVAFDKLPTPVDGIRTQLRAAVRLIGNPDIRLLRTTVEVFDSGTGKNTIFIGDPED